MTDLTHQQLLDAIARSLKETGMRMAVNYRGVAADQPGAVRWPTPDHRPGKERRGYLDSRFRGNDIGGDGAIENGT